MDERIDELVFMGLRLAEGISMDRFRSLTGRALDEVLLPAKVNALIAEGYLERTNADVRATRDGAQRLNGVISYLLA
jgi:oxygen-independent coproporphyrinogen-3 oxidase